MKVIVGLGNPGKKYRDTRHNLGFKVIEEISSNFPKSSSKRKFKCQIKIIEINKEEILLVQPLTFMNLCGPALFNLLKFYKIEIKNILVICDDINLPLGKIRLRSAGSSGGHKGLQSIIDSFQSNKFPRLRIGIGKPEENAIDYVLGKFKEEEKKVISDSIKSAAEIVEKIIIFGLEKCMSKYN